MSESKTSPLCGGIGPEGITGTQVIGYWANLGCRLGLEYSNAIEEAAKRDRRIAQIEGEAVELMRQQVAQGYRRDDVVLAARKAGIKNKVTAAALGLTESRVSQICRAA